MNTTTLQSANSVNGLHARLAFLLIPLACFALSPTARATCQEGCLTNQNTVLGDDALINLTTGAQNTAIGFNALESNTSGNFNTAIGDSVLASNTLGGDNTAIGFQTLFGNTTGFRNTAVGNQTLTVNTAGAYNTAIGFNALLSNTTGSSNVAIGNVSLNSNATGYGNTAVGGAALFSNTDGIFNTAIGSGALDSNATGNGNTAIGYVALNDNTTAHSNTAIGDHALFRKTTGDDNTAIGDSAGIRLATGDHNIYIGSFGRPRESRTIHMGESGVHTATFIAGVSGTTVAGGVGVIVDSNGQLGTVTSSERFKDSIKPMDQASEAILALKPVTFRYKHELDPKGIPQFGLVAEDVEKVNPDLVARDEQGKPYSVRYEAVNAMLLNEFLKARRQIDAQQKQIDALTAGLQKVSVQVEVSKSAPETVVVNQ